MASINKIIAAPPLQADIVDTNLTTKLNNFWSRWFNDLHYSLSDRSWQTITSATAINVNAKYVALDSSAGGYAVTLDAPTKPNAKLQIECTNYGGNVTLSLTNVTGGSAATTCTWNSVNDTIFLESKSNKWVVIKENGVSLT